MQVKRKLTVSLEIMLRAKKQHRCFGNDNVLANNANCLLAKLDTKVDKYRFGGDITSFAKKIVKIIRKNYLKSLYSHLLAIEYSTF